MTDVQRQLLEILSCTLYGRSSSLDITQEVLSEAREQAVSSLITKDYSVMGTNIRVIRAHAELTTLLQPISFTTFKGYASAYYYPEPFNRPMGDVDFIVNPDQYLKAVETLTKAGFCKEKKGHDRHVSFHKNKVLFELHSEIKGMPNGPDGIKTRSIDVGRRITELFSNLFETAIAVETQQGTILIPDEFHHGLIMLMHVAGHMMNDRGVGLRHLCDWAVYVNKVDLSKFRKELEETGLWTFACQLTAVSSCYLGLPPREWMGDWDDKFLSGLIDEFLSAGNFGNKEAERIGFATMRNTSFAEMTKKHYPAANNSLLLPLFMMLYILRYGFLVLAGKRRFIKPAAILNYKGQNDLYKQFKLFEV